MSRLSAWLAGHVREVSVGLHVYIRTLQINISYRGTPRPLTVVPVSEMQNAVIRPRNRAVEEVERVPSSQIKDKKTLRYRRRNNDISL